MGSLLITGATGNVGVGLVQTLKERGIEFYSTTRDPEKADETRRFFDFERPESFPVALAGIEKLFLIRPPELADVKKYFRPLIEEAQKQDVRQIVFLSVMGTEFNKIVPHARIERVIKKSGIAYTFLRPSFFMQNITGQHGEELRNEHTLFVPAGNGRTSFIDARDIGEVAAICLTQPGHERKAYTLTGSEALTYYQVAEIFTEELGFPVSYPRPSSKEFKKQMLEKGLPSEFVNVMSVIYFTTRIGLAKKVTPELQKLLGRAPRTVRQFAREYKSTF